MAKETLSKGRSVLGPEQLTAKIGERIGFREARVGELTGQISHLVNSVDERGLTLVDASRTVAGSLFSPKTPESLERKAGQLLRSRKLAELGSRFPAMPDQVKKAWEVILHEREAVKAEKRQIKRAQRESFKKKQELSAYHKWFYYVENKDRIEETRTELISQFKSLDWRREDERVISADKLRMIESMIPSELLGMPGVRLRGKLIEELLEYAKPKSEQLQKIKKDTLLRKLIVAGEISAVAATVIFAGITFVQGMEQRIPYKAPSLATDLVQTPHPTIVPAQTAVRVAELAKPAETALPASVKPPATAVALPTPTGIPPEDIPDTVAAGAAVEADESEQPNHAPASLPRTGTPPIKSELNRENFEEALNYYRLENNLPQITEDPDLCRIAESELEFIKSMPSSDPDNRSGLVDGGRNLFTKFKSIKRNLSQGFKNTLDLIRAWDQSAAEHANLVNPLLNSACFSADSDNSVLILAQTVKE